MPSTIGSEPLNVCHLPTGLVPPNGTSDRRGRAILMISAMLGAINLSRAVSDPNLSREILQQTRDQLTNLNKTGKPRQTADATRKRLRRSLRLRRRVMDKTPGTL